MKTALPFLAVFCLRTWPVAGAHPIMLDGYFHDWDAIQETWIDTEGDAPPGGIDFRSFTVTNDTFALFIRVVMSRDLLHHEGNTMVLWVDSDRDGTTGFPVGGIGAELEWRFGSRFGLLHGVSVDTVL